MLQNQRFLFSAILVGSLLSLCAVKLWSRLMSPPAMADVRDLAEKAPIVFRGRVVKVSSPGEQPRRTYVVNSIATI